jgi:hypothetical protein
MRLSRFLASRLFLSALAATALAACGSAAGPAATGTPTPKPLGPALVQVENSPDARPLSGLQQADLVFEYLTEGGITRMTAVYFHPSGSQKIEPVRSARLITLRLQKAYQGVIFYSGASNHVQSLITGQGIPALREGSDGGIYFARDQSRSAPHNLTTTPDKLAQGLQAHAPRINYTLPAPGRPAASPAPGAANRVSFQQTPSHPVTYTYSPADNAYAYSTDTGPLLDTDTGQPIKPVNVILIQVAHHGMGYTEDVLGEQGIDFDLQGQGPGDLFTGGHHYSITWDLTNPAQPLVFKDSAGRVVQLPRGLTWVHLVDPGTVISVS